MSGYKKETPGFYPGVSFLNNPFSPLKLWKNCPKLRGQAGISKKFYSGTFLG